MQELDIFLVAARHPSFRAAADELGIDRSAVSKAIARLEERVSTRLFHRNSRSVHLTDAGERLATEARVPVSALRDLLDDLSSGRPRGMVRVAAPLAFGLRTVAPVLHRFLREHPEIDVTITYDDHLHDLTRDGIDIAIRGGQLEDSSLVSRRLFVFGVALMAAPNFTPVPLAHPRELSEHPLILPSASPITFTKGTEAYTLHPRPHLVTRATQARVAAARAGVGATLVPTFADTTGLVDILPGWSLAGRRAFHLLRPSGPQSAAARALWRTFAAELRHP